ncbi:MAG: hypothetical protein ACC726_14440, partial [Chloroflexota bacterium]
MRERSWDSREGDRYPLFNAQALAFAVFPADMSITWTPRLIPGHTTPHSCRVFGLSRRRGGCFDRRTDQGSADTL